MSVNLNRAELRTAMTNREYVIITMYRGYDFDCCFCDYAKHEHPDTIVEYADGTYRRYWGFRGYKRPRRKHYRMLCRRSDAAHDSWKLHRKTQYREVTPDYGKD